MKTTFAAITLALASSFACADQTYQFSGDGYFSNTFTHFSGTFTISEPVEVRHLVDTVPVQEGVQTTFDVIDARFVVGNTPKDFLAGAAIFAQITEAERGAQFSKGDTLFARIIFAEGTLTLSTHSDAPGELPGSFESYSRTSMSFNGSPLFMDTIEAIPAVPEPETYLMLLAGLGLVAFRKKTP